MFAGIDKAALTATGLTIAVSLFSYGAGMIIHFDERIDLLEKQMQTLLDGEGKVRPSPEAMRAAYSLESFENRLTDLELAHPNDHK